MLVGKSSGQCRKIAALYRQIARQRVADPLFAIGSRRHSDKATERCCEMRRVRITAVGSDDRNGIVSSRQALARVLHTQTRQEPQRRLTVDLSEYAYEVKPAHVCETREHF